MFYDHFLSTLWVFSRKFFLKKIKRNLGLNFKLSAFLKRNFGLNFKLSPFFKEISDSIFDWVKFSQHTRLNFKMSHNFIFKNGIVWLWKMLDDVFQQILNPHWHSKTPGICKLTCFNLLIVKFFSIFSLIFSLNMRLSL